MTRLLNPITLSARFGAVTLAFILGLCSAGASAQSGDPPRNLLPTELPGGQAPAKPTAVHNVRGFLPDLSFELQGPGGKTLTEKDFLGKTVLVFFGYASCPDICPTTMAQLAQVMDKLGRDAAGVSILFVSVDPHRDTPEVLDAYVRAFDNHAIGLTGTEKQISSLARRYRVAYQIQKPSGADGDDYEVAHSRGIYIFDKSGRARILASDSETTDAITDAVRALLQES
ncbi:MAG: SCO family protein [Candidimonas sp.]